MKKTLLLLPCLAVGTTALLLAPAKNSFGFSKLGTSLSVSNERDWRMFNDFRDSQSNNNQTADPNFPGWFGADMALWKAAVEWGSVAHGNGDGDPTQTNLGDGDANFDFFFAGAATGDGGISDEIVSTLSSCGGGGTLAYVVQTGFGWQMEFCDEWTWADGPSSINGGQYDIQSVGCHEFGHSLGLGHSNTGSATMFGSIGSGSTGQRSINSDDISGIQCVYGSTNPGKVTITNANVDIGTNTVTIDGTDFSATGNEVWFTRAAASSPGTSSAQVKVTGVSSTGGGTQITVTIPSAAGSGDLAVKSGAGSSGDDLSNSWPADLMNGGGSIDPLVITSVTPGTVECLIPGTAQTVTIAGTGFDSSIALSLDLVAIPSSNYTVVDDETITVDMPQTSGLGLRTFLIQKGVENAFSTINVVAPSAPVVQAGDGDGGSAGSTIDVFVAGPVGEFDYVMYSFSNVPSKFLPFACLDIGNNFFDLNLLASYVIPSAGWTSQNFPLNPGFAVIFIQSLTLDQGLPAVDSNVQQFLLPL